MPDLGQVIPFNASVPHLSNGGNNTDLPHRGVVRHCKSKLKNTLESSMEDALSRNLSLTQVLILTELLPGLDILSDFGRFSAPTPHQSC